jgi:hypothetical protein
MFVWMNECLKNNNNKKNKLKKNVLAKKVGKKNNVIFNWEKKSLENHLNKKHSGTAILK